jgi:hypothetical protein
MARAADIPFVLANFNQVIFKVSKATGEYVAMGHASGYIYETAS